MRKRSRGTLASSSSGSLTWGCRLKSTDPRSGVHSSPRYVVSTPTRSGVGVGAVVV